MWINHKTTSTGDTLHMQKRVHCQTYILINQFGWFRLFTKHYSRTHIHSLSELLHPHSHTTSTQIHSGNNNKSTTSSYINREGLRKPHTHIQPNSARALLAHLFTVTEHRAYARFKEFRPNMGIPMQPDTAALPQIHIVLRVIQPQAHLDRIAFAAPVKNVLHGDGCLFGICETSRFLNRWINYGGN